MKKLFHLILLTGLFTRSELSAQYQYFTSMPYQGVARDPSGNPVANQTISVRFQLQYGLSDAYIETQSLVTNAFGVFSAQIGAGTPVGGTFPSFDAIDWWGGFTAGLQVWIDITGGTSYVQAGTTSLRSVPFAVMAEQSFALRDSVLYASAFPDGVYMKPNAKMGLGTTTPQSVLDVEGGTSIGAAYSGTTAAPANGLLVEGNVGIGNNNPQAKLHVTGTTRLVDGTQGAGKVLTSDANGDVTWSTVVSSGAYTPTFSSTTGFVSIPTCGCEYNRVGTLVHVVCTTGASAMNFAAGSNTVNMTVPAALPVANVLSLGLVNGTFSSDHYRNGAQTTNGTVSQNNASTVRLTMRGSTAGLASAYWDFTYKTSAP